jgi:hypothetical protein
MPEGDSIKRVAIALQPLVGEIVERRGARADARRAVAALAGRRPADVRRLQRDGPAVPALRREDRGVPAR